MNLVQAEKPQIISLNIYDISDEDEETLALQESLQEFEEECAGLRVNGNQEPMIGHVIGTKVVSALWASREGHISYAVHPDYRGGGLAKELIQAYIAESREIGLEQVTAEAINATSVRILKSLGFKEDSVTGPRQYKLDLSNIEATSNLKKLPKASEIDQNDWRVNVRFGEFDVVGGYAKGPKGRCFKAEAYKGTERVAALRLQPNDDDGTLISDNMWTLDLFRGKGLMTAIMDAVEEELDIVIEPSEDQSGDTKLFWKKRHTH